MHLIFFSGENKIIFTMDITSLYMLIPNNEGLQALKYFLNVLLKNQARKPYFVWLNWFSHSTVFHLATATTNKSTVLQWESIGT